MTTKKISTHKQDTINTQNVQASSLSASAFSTPAGHSEFESRTLDFIERLDGAYSDHTIRAYRYNLWQISLFCQKHVYLIDALMPEQFNHYLLEDCKNDKASTIDRRISSYREYLHFIQAPNVTKHPDVKFCLRKIYRRIGCLRKQARPLQRHEVDLMLVTCDLDNPCGLRNAVMLELGYHSMRQILYGLQNAAGIEGENFSSHSFRVGGALDYLEAGMPIEKIMLKGGWHSGSTVIQYLRAWEDI